MIKILDNRRIRFSDKFLVFLTSVFYISFYISCSHSVNLSEAPKHSQEYPGLLKFYNDATISILESKKAGNRIFAKYRKDILTGLISTYKDSVMFANDMFFRTEDAQYQSFDFIDSLTVAFKAEQIFEDKLVVCKYIFRFNDFSNNWLLHYAEKKEFTTEQASYQFVDSFRQDFSMENFSLTNFSANFSGSAGTDLFHYKYRKKNYLDSISIQIHNMMSANVVSLKNIFTVDHAEEILADYPVNAANVILLNNIAYYLEHMSITMSAIIILETVIAEYPDRTVGYLNLGDALMKNGLKIKARKIYNRYIELMRAKGKQNEIPQRLFAITKP